MRMIFAVSAREFVRPVWVLALVALLARGGSSRAELPPPLSGTAPDSALAATLAAMDGDRLTLEDALEAAFRNSTALGSAEAAWRAAEAARGREGGRFWPELDAEISRSRDEIPSASPFAGGSVLRPEESFASTGLRWRLPIGTEFSASVNATRTETNSSFAALNPQVDAEGRIDVVQPLLKGFGPAAWAEYAATSRTEEAAEAAWRDALLLTRATVIGTYWELYAAERDFAVQQLIRDRARSFADEAQVRSRAGLGGPGQVANARVFLAEQEQAVLDRRDQVESASDRLASLIGRRPESRWSRFHPVDEPPVIPPAQPIDSLLARARRTNFVLRALERQVEAARARARGATWDALPALDLFGSIGGRGLAGTPRGIVFGGDTLLVAESGAWSDAIGEATGRDHPSWSAGLRLTIPVGLHEGRARRATARAELRRAEEAWEAGRRSLDEAVRAAWREVEGGAERLDLARAGVEASQEQVRIGTLEYRAGRSTAFELVRLGADLAAAQQRYSRALVRAARSAAELERLTGNEAMEANAGGSRRNR